MNDDVGSLERGNGVDTELTHTVLNDRFKMDVISVLQSKPRSRITCGRGIVMSFDV